MSGVLVSVNVGTPRTVPRGSREARTAIWKDPVDGRVALRGVNLAGDDQADRRYHGGPDKAVYAYAEEDGAWWQARLDRELGPGAFGENLTTRGLHLGDARVGQRWAVGDTVLEVCQPRVPCFKLGLRFGDPGMVRAFARARRPGAYLRVVREGELGAGDRVEVVAEPDHDVTIALVYEALLHDRSLLARLLEAPELATGLREFALEHARAA